MSRPYDPVATFRWQARFHDRVIPDRAGAAAVAAYIRRHPPAINPPPPDGGQRISARRYTAPAMDKPRRYDG